MKFNINDLVKYPKKDRNGGVVFQLETETNKVFVKWPDGSVFRYKEDVLEADNNVDFAVSLQPDNNQNNIDWDRYNGFRNKDKFITVPLKDEEINWEKYHNIGKAK